MSLKILNILMNLIELIRSVVVTVTSVWLKSAGEIDS